MDMNNNICMNIMQHNSRRGALQGSAAPERKYRNVFAGRLLMLLMLLGLVFGKAWGADIRYHIINNDGKECFRYVIKGDYKYSSIDKTKLCVHPWARSVVATDFRFYINREDAVTDANGLVGSHFFEGDVISEVAPGTTEFYVRYSMMSPEELTAAGYTYDPEGNMTYLMQIRERYAKGGKRRQVYYDTTDERFEFGSPGSNNTDIPFENLQKGVQYRFRVVSNDPYNTYLYNGAAEAQNANGVLTVSGISRDNNQKAKERVSYETKISNYDPETTTTLQSFFFVAASSQILQSSWSSEYIGKMFIVGAVGGKDYYMRDIGSANSSGSVESYVPYMLCANGNLGNFTDPGFQLQCYQSWRNYDYNNDNTSLVLMTPYENTHKVTYHIVNSADTSKDVLTIVQRHGSTSEFDLYNRDRLERIGCTLSDKYYSDRECNTEYTTTVLDNTYVYIPYTFDAVATKAATGLEFSTEDAPKWFSLTIRQSNVKLLTYDAEKNVINSKNNLANEESTPDPNRVLQESQFAFIGDPYSFRIICKAADGKYAYVDTENLSGYSNTLNNIRFGENPEETYSTWAMIPGTKISDSTGDRFMIFRRDGYAAGHRAFWDAYYGSNQIDTYAQPSYNAEQHVDQNMRAKETPKYNYCYNIVDNSGRIAIKYTIKQYATTRLDGKFGHEAIPDAIYSPYLEGEELTFYSTFTTENDLTSLAGKIVQTPNSSANIFVRYKQDLMSTRTYPLNGKKSYFMQLGSEYVICDGGVTTQSVRPTFEDPDTKKWVLESNNPNNNAGTIIPDPYDVSIRNLGNDTRLLNVSENKIRFIIMSSKGADPADGQIELLFANGQDLSTASNSKSLALDGSSVAETTTDPEYNANQQIVFIEAILKRTYRLIDKQGKILLEYESTELNEGEVEDESGYLGVPKKWRSPLISYTKRVNCGYKYYKRSAFSVSGGDTYSLTENARTISYPTESSDGYIYVTYDAITDKDDPNYVDMNLAFKDIDERVRRSATNANMDRDATKLGQLYLLEFTSSEDYYLENTGDRVDTKVTTSGSTIYPYTNGDGPLYIRHQEQLENDLKGGSSTRTRWSWYILSPDNDPYHVMVSSWQATHTKSDILTSYYNYLRTYYNSEIEQIITGNISDDPRTVDEEGNRIMPTEYMLLGTKDNYLLVTSEEIGNDKSGYNTTNHRTVTSLEQYWRNNPTVHRTLNLKDGSGPITAEQEETLKSKGWHKYKAWVNAAAWSGSTSSSNKSYAYDDHWFMTVNVGSGNFKLEKIDIDAVLVLVDNHGWEIMRQPIPKHSETERYENAKKALRKWDSPMVKEYKFYATRNVTHKVNGYHKYNIYDDYAKDDGKWLKKSDIKGRGVSLADYPEEFTGSALLDLYVSYTVKPEYAQAYTGAASEGTVEYPFLIRQDGKLAKASDATTLTTIETSSTGIDSGTVDVSGTVVGIGDENLYWYLKPNFEIDIEMGYVYDIREKADDATSHLYTKEETNTRYHSEGASGFDPYNIQIYNKANPTAYFTTDATAAAIESGQYMKTTNPAGEGAVSLESKINLSGYVNSSTGYWDKDYEGTPEKFRSQVITYDSKILKITNQTFMAVQDANGNMRLMPRFGQNQVIQCFSTLKEQAREQPESDKAHPQTTWLLRPTVYTYYVIDNQGDEALRYKLLSAGAPMIPAMFKSPLAKDFTFYATYTTPGTVTSLTDEITGSLTDDNIKDKIINNKVYVRYNYNPDADTDGLLKGMWYNAKLNSNYVKVQTTGIAADTYTDESDVTEHRNATHRWRFMESAGNDSDPYAVTLWNGTPATETSGNSYIIMNHFDGTNTADYALMQAGTGTTTYSFLDYNSGSPTIIAQSDYSTDGIIADTKKLTLTPVLATNSIVYKVITKTGYVALTSGNIPVDDSYELSLPEWMQSPLMNDDAYIYYSSYKSRTATTLTTDGYKYDELGGETTTTPKSLDDNVVYVRYDYEKSKKDVTSFEMPDLAGLPYNYAPLDLSGNVMYTIGISSNDNGKIWSVGTGAEKTITKDTETDVKVSTELTRPARLWRFTGDDPYEVKIYNPSTSPTAVLAGVEPADGPAALNDKGEVIKPNDVYPLVHMKESGDEGYPYRTFMVLKYNPHEVTTTDNLHRKGTLKLYVTGHDNLFMAESNSLAGGVYIYKDAKSYKERYADKTGEPSNPVATNGMIIYSNFFYRPVLTYHVITNDKKEALKGYSLMAGTTVELPQIYQSPLLNSSDFTYYTKATKEGSDYTVDDKATTAASTTIASLATKSIGDIYVRYKEYDPATSPFKIATNIDDAAEDGTRLDWTDEKGLDLSGDPANPNKGGTWYTIADMQDRFNDDHGNVFGVKSVTETTTTFEKTKVNELTNGRAPSNKEYLWKLMGNDPYAFRIYNAQHGQYLSVQTTGSKDNRKMSLQDKDADGYYQTFMLLEAHGNDNEISDFGTDSEGNFNYQLRRWTSLIASGTKVFTRVTTDNDATTGNLNARDWDFNIRNFSNYDIRMSGDSVGKRQILSMGAGGTGLYCVEFVKAPVTRKYRYHAIQFDAEGKKVGQTWEAILEHDWLQPVVLEDNIARLFCKYEKRNTPATTDEVEGTNSFLTRADLEAEGQPNAQFYSDDGLSQRVKNNVVPGASGEYDVYPEIELEQVYDIYFKYQVDTDTPLNLAGSEKKLSDITSTPLQIANDKAHYAATGRLDPTYYTGDGHGKWFFMVLDTDDAMSATGAKGSRTYTGNQYFLRREDDGTVSWMNNRYTLHPKKEDNYNEWEPSRVVEWYKKGDNDPYREGRWLWTFVGTDPYNMKIVNMESVVGVNTNAEGVYSLAAADNCWTTIGQTTLSNGAIAYPVTVPTAEPTGNQYWGLCNGYDTEGTMSLLSTAITLTDDNEIKVNQPLYWNMQSRTINRKTTQSVEGDFRSNDRANAIQLIPYVPVKYQDINLVIKREDHVKDYTTWVANRDWSGKTDYEIKTDKADRLQNYDSGISLLYFTAAERTFVAGDKINLGTQFSLPVNVLRAFCKYTLYQDDYQTPYNKDIERTWYYTVTDGPYPTSTQATTQGKWSGTGTEGDPYVYNKVTEPATDYGELLYDEDGKPVYTYTSDGTTSGIPAVGAQSIYVKYEVTSDIFLKEAPRKEQVEAMAQNNDHVYFMDFPTYDSKGNEITHHAFYDPEATTFIQTGDLSKNKDKNTGIWVPEKKSWSGSGYASDFTNSYNATQYRTADDRMVSTPDKLKWYFVGDPYKLQVFSTAGAWNTAALKDENGNVIMDTSKEPAEEAYPANSVNAQLARFNTVETNFKFVSDCVHVRLPDYTHIDNRPELIPTDERGVAMPDKAFPNRNNGKPYVNDFYWECVPAASKENGTFALRFKEDNDLLGYRNVYYYLGRDGKTMVYNADEEKPQKYHINLNYRPNNERYEDGDYLGYHKANNDSTIIRLVQPVKVYITTHRSGDDRYAEKTNVTVNEYSGYYGLGETISGVPRHLQRKYVSYNTLDHNGVGSATHNLTISNADSHGTCGTSPYDNIGTLPSNTHSQTINDLMTNKVSKEPVNPVFRFSVYYNVDDLTSNGIHLFTNNISSPTWLDVMVGSNSWFYYDKTNVGGTPAAENQTSRVSNYRRAVSENKSSGWNNSADGWNDGLKGLHWAFVGDPYDFTILNRRRYEDAGALNATGQPMWLAAKKSTINNYAGVADSIVWSATMVDNIGSYTTNTSTATEALGNDGINAHWSLQMWKLGDANYYFLRTASLTEKGNSDSQTDKYWRMMAKHNGTNEFYAEPYALDDHSRYTSDKKNLSWNNYVTNDMRYSKTMNGLGVYEQRLQIRTAVAEDNDKADNDCFDAKVEIRTKDGKLRISKDKLEIKYGIAADMLPYTLRRYGCEYTCYVNYNESANTGDELTRLRDSNTPMDDGESREFANREYTLLSNAIAATPPGQNVTLTYIYEVTDDVAQFFTTASDALTEDYTWTNTYFAWDQMYSGTNVEIEYYVDVFDHYVYDANGQIIDAVYIKERRTRVESNPKQAYPTTAYLNTHTNQVNVFADESTQSKDDRQKWSLVGDPYEFTMKNYAQYLVNNNATQLLDKGLMTQTTIPVQAQNFAIAVDKNGNSYLSVIDSNGEVTTNMSFTFSTSSDKTVQTVGDGVNDNDPTGHTLDTENVKPFKLANLLSYADIVQYHLVIAHQHSLDPDNSQVYLDLSKADDDEDVAAALGEDATKTANRATFKSHLLEYLMYQGIQKGQKDMFVNLDASGKPSSMKTDWVDGNGKYVIKSLLKENASLRDFLSYPIDDYRVARVGIGNHPQVPWYMKRQFCRYFLYQSDVLRSEVDNDSPALEVADADWGSSTIEIGGVEYKLNPSSPYAVNVYYYNGKFYLEVVENNVITKPSADIRAAGTRYEGLVQRTFEEDGETKPAFNIKWVSIFDQSSGWDDWTTADETASKSDQVLADRKVNVGTEGSPVWKKAPKYYKQALALQGTVLDRLQECHYNRMVKIDVVYEVIPEAFQFAYRGRNTTAWYQMMTNSNSGGGGGTDYLMNFSYSNHIGIKAGRDTHYTNDYLWAPEGDPYGFVLRSRYSTINGNGFNATAVTTTGELPKKGEEYTASEAPSYYEATYTNAMPFISRLIIHTLKGKTLPPPSSGTAGDDSMSNGIYEMFTGDATFGNSFLMHPTTAYIDTSDPEFSSYYMMRDTDGRAKLKYKSARTLQSDVDANWYLTATTEQLLPYFERAGYVGGISPTRVAADFNYQDYYDQLLTAKENGTALDFSLLRKIQEKVYDGTFKDANGATVAEGTERSSVVMPMTFVSTNLVNMTDGYYRIAGFSTAQLNAAEKENATPDHEGIQGQRYVSGYRFKSELDGSKPLRFFETTKDAATIHTFADLDAATPFTAEAPLWGNIELLPADFDPSSIFRFTGDVTSGVQRYTLSSQGVNLQVYGSATKMSATGTKLRLEDVGGAAVTLRSLSTEPAGNWDSEVVNTIKTNYLTSTGDSYSISMCADNELNETSASIQDTKWLLQPVGVHEEWPYNEMPLRVEVNKGGVKNYALTGADLTAPENQDNNYYGTLYVPFDTRLSNTTDAAFTLTNTPTNWGTTTEPGKVTMASVSRLNEMGNPQFVPAKWPVVLRTSDKNKVVTLVNEGHTENNPKVYAERHYVNMYIPNVTPTTISGVLDDIKLSGQYLEQTLTGVDDKTIMVFGLPFADHNVGADNDALHHEYARTTKQVGWYTNDNWARENAPTKKAHKGSYPDIGDGTLVATDASERDNKYVYHNKVYYVLDSGSSGAKFNIAIFEEEWETEKEDDGPIDESVGKKRVPWPCDVYDLQGRRVAENETPETLRRNNPSLPKGVYIFVGKKVVIK